MRYLLCLLFLLGAVAAEAHRINIFATYENGILQGEVFFNDGKPARSAKVEIITPYRTFSTKTDTEGRFSISLPQGFPELKIVAYAGMGHRAETIVKSAGPSPPSPKPVPWQDIFCGLGYIVGIFGLLAYLKGKSKRHEHRPAGS